MTKTAFIIAYHGTKHNFDSLDPDKSGLGTHFGDYRTAVKRLKHLKRMRDFEEPLIQRYQLNIHNPLRLPDIGGWDSPPDLEGALIRAGILTLEDYAVTRQIKSDKAAFAELRRLIEKAGYDSVVYPNNIEGSGSMSYIVWNNSLVKRLPDPKVPQYLKAANDMHAKSIALIKFLSAVARRLGVAEHIYVVGGAPRNFILGEKIKDVDVVTDSVALKGKDSAWFAKEVAKAIPVETSVVTNNYGVAIISVKQSWILEGQDLEGEVVEIANARKEAYDSPGGYRPTDVVPASIREDTARRELTFNTLLWRLYDVADGVDKAPILDLCGTGLKDLKDGVMRCPSDPDTTFKNDASRMIRIVKFSIKYGFKLDPAVEAALHRNVQKIKNIPPGHLSNMIINTFYEAGTGKQAFLEMEKLGILDVIKEIIETNRSFRDALGNWAEKHADIGFIFDLMDLNMPVGHALSFLTPTQKSRLRENLVGFKDSKEADTYILSLQQPGKLVDMPKLIQQLGLKGPSIKILTDNVRQLLLDDPASMHAPSHLESLVTLKMSKMKTAVTNVASRYLKQASQAKVAK